MGLFSKSKEEKDFKLTGDIKQASNEPTLGENLSNLNLENTQNQNTNQFEQPNQTTSTFNNPFAQNTQPQNQMEQLNLNQQNTQPNQTQTNPINQQQMTNELPQLNLNQQNTQNQNQPSQIPELKLDNNLQTNTQPNELNQNQMEPLNLNQQNTQPQINEPSQINQQQNSTSSIFNLNSNEQKSVLPSDQSQNPQNTNLNQQQKTQPQTNPLEQIQQKQEFTKDQIQELVDETVEQVIEERWQDIVSKIEKVAAWKEKQEQHINLIKEDIITIKESFEKLEKRIISKVSDYDKNILDVNSEIKALEKVFQKITPTLVNNVNELSNIAKTFKPDSKTNELE